MQHKLILLTSGYPYGTGEPFLETEIEYLAQGFDSILIFCPKPTTTILRNTPENVIVYPYSNEVKTIHKLKSLLGAMDGLFLKEKKIIPDLYQLKLSKQIVSTALISLFQAKRLKKRLETAIDFSDPNVKFYGYSYWCDDSALTLALLKSKNASFITISRVHGWDLYFEASKIGYLPYRQFIVKKLDNLFPISIKGKNYIREQWKIKETDSIRVSHLGVNERKAGKLKSEVFTLVSCSNLIPLKRVNLIIDALSNIKIHQIHWIHLGDGRLLSELEEEARKKLQKGITFEFKGRLTNTEVIDFYLNNAADLFINVSSTEGIPVSIMEAMSFGIPVIATDVGGTSEIVNNENGHLLAANPDAAEIAGIIESFASDNDLRALKSKAAWEMWNQKFNARKNYADFVNSLLNLKSST